MRKLISAWPQSMPLLAAAASALALGGAYTSQYGFGLEPCPLCLYQRWPYFLVIALGLGSLAAPQGARPWLIGLAALAFLGGAGVAAYHVGVEQQWWQGSVECTGGPPAATVEELRAQLLGRKPARCDEVAFAFLGLSMAGWNMLYSLGLAALSLLALRRARQGEGGP
jgi:disulfide bond formation protein DsbB